MVRANSSLQAEAAEPPKASEASVAGAAFVIRSAYDRLRVRVGLVCLESEDRTQQAFKDECDINFLMKRYEKTGILPSGREDMPQYADVTGIDFMTSAQQVADIRGVFSMLDARTRARFENDPAQMLDFLADPANMEEAVSMGLMPKPERSSDERGKDRAGVAAAGRARAEGATVGEAGRDAVAADRGAAVGASDGAAAGSGAGQVKPAGTVGT